ncbi:hypothetical protein [Floccifex sp.]|uniref:hypothetical protein n=1 Tax=Floccifex sp. TaxID=2815810 RepID=UPI002A756B58|nr:hypothetical protein [Floccifex sp.]MDD7280534.1 hypothetical protein [Erysipelotrichaceae bacterium]MDY2959164.1 hypothetical protein [Floccifex sp.]
MDISQSVSYNELKKQNVKIIVCDNSEIKTNNQMVVQQDNQVYLSMNGNKGLSYAYNRAIDYIFSQTLTGKEKICLFDDDTQISDDYFQVMERSNSDICLPKVYDEKSLLSPSLMINGKSIRWDESQPLDKKNISGINSGMCIQASVFENYRYDESLFLDYVDHYFLFEMKRQGKSIEVVDTILHQSFSANSNDLESELNRFKLFKKDSEIFYRLTKLRGYHYTLLKRKLGLMLRYKKTSLMWRL